jgi:serine/threonine protein kinase
MKPRSFNTIETDVERSLVRKSSTDVEILKNEILFYVNAPERIKKLMPKLYRYSEDFSWYEMEYLSWTTLTELANSKELSPEEWASIFFAIWEAYEVFDEKLDETNFSQLYMLFIHKALIRARDTKNKELKNIFFDDVTLNGKSRKSLADLLISNMGVLFKVTKEVSLLHGDFCFSNIMISSDLKKIKVVDPRGGFEEPSIYGPKAYDIAKLAQSCYSWYDKIVENQYKLTGSDNGYDLTLTGQDWTEDARIAFDPMLETMGLTESDARILAGLMLAGTPTLHLDDPEKAVALALNAMLLLSSDLR